MTTRIQFIPADLAESAESYQQGTIGADTSGRELPTIRVNGGAVRYNAGDDQVAQPGVTRHAVSFDGVAGGSILATRQRVNGADTVELVPGAPGSRTHLSQALKAGLIKETAPGVYADATTAEGAQRTLETVQAEHQQAERAQQAQQEQQQAVDNEGIFNAEEDAAWRADMADIPEHAFNSAAASVTNAVVLGTDLSSAAETLSRETGLEPLQAAEVVDNATWYFTQIVARAVEKVGVGEEQREAFFADCRDNPGKLNNALSYLLHGRDPSQFQAMAREWLARGERVAQVDNDRRAAETSGRPGIDAEVAPGMSEETLRAAGFETSVSRQGVLMVKRGPNGKWVAASALLKG